MTDPTLTPHPAAVAAAREIGRLVAPTADHAEPNVYSDIIHRHYAPVLAELEQARAARMELEDHQRTSVEKIEKQANEIEKHKADVDRLTNERNEATRTSQRLYSIIGDCDFIAFDNSEPAQLWSFQGLPEDDGIPEWRVKAVDGMAELATLRQQVADLIATNSEQALELGRQQGAAEGLQRQLADVTADVQRKHDESWSWMRACQDGRQQLSEAQAEAAAMRGRLESDRRTLVSQQSDHPNPGIRKSMQAQIDELDKILSPDAGRELLERHQRELEEVRAKDVEPLMRDERWGDGWSLAAYGLTQFVVQDDMYDICRGPTPPDACRAALEKGAGS